MEAARNAAAGEVIALSLERQGVEARASLRRIAADGRVIGTASFPVPAGSDDRDLRLLGDAVGVQLRRVYPDRRPRPGVPDLAVSDRGYAELLRIKNRIDQGTTDLRPELEKLDVIVRDSPRFLAGHLLLADVAQSLFSSKRQEADLARGLQAARAAAEIAPGDPRPLRPAQAGPGRWALRRSRSRAARALRHDPGRPPAPLPRGAARGPPRRSGAGHRGALRGRAERPLLVQPLPPGGHGGPGRPHRRGTPASQGSAGPRPQEHLGAQPSGQPGIAGWGPAARRADLPGHPPPPAPPRQLHQSRARPFTPWASCRGGGGVPERAGVRSGQPLPPPEPGRRLARPGPGERGARALRSHREDPGPHRIRPPPSRPFRT